jgi:hypothetical protein
LRRAADAIVEELLLNGNAGILSTGMPAGIGMSGMHDPILIPPSVLMRVLTLMSPSSMRGHAGERKLRSRPWRQEQREQDQQAYER